MLVAILVVFLNTTKFDTKLCISFVHRFCMKYPVRCFILSNYHQILIISIPIHASMKTKCTARCILLSQQPFHKLLSHSRRVSFWPSSCRHLLLRSCFFILSCGAFLPTCKERITLLGYQEPIKLSSAHSCGLSRAFMTLYGRSFMTIHEVGFEVHIASHFILLWCFYANT